MRLSRAKHLHPVDKDIENYHKNAVGRIVIISDVRRSGVTTGPADPASEGEGGGGTRGGRQNRSKIWDIFCRLIN